jgi:hypothetical protein
MSDFYYLTITTLLVAAAGVALVMFLAEHL